MENFDSDAARRNMLTQQFRTWHVLDDRVLSVMAQVPRERFAPEAHRKLAFADLEIPLGHGQSMMAPKIEARVLQSLRIGEDDTILEIGTGSGYLTACLARLGNEVDSVEIHEDFVQRARHNLDRLGIEHARLHSDDASGGWGRESHYDVIAVTGSIPEYQNRFEKGLAVGGRMFVVVGEPPVMEAMLVERTGRSDYSRSILFETELAPLVNATSPPRFVL